MFTLSHTHFILYFITLNQTGRFIPEPVLERHVMSENRNVRTATSDKRVTASFPRKIIKMPKALHLGSRVCVHSGPCAIILACSLSAVQLRRRRLLLRFSPVCVVKRVGPTFVGVCDHFAELCACISVLCSWLQTLSCDL